MKTYDLTYWHRETKEKLMVRKVSNSGYEDENGNKYSWKSLTKNYRADFRNKAIGRAKRNNNIMFGARAAG